mmetsp:Transcript_1238/g.3729  ORF Transcript_1238/g.3729 Transcript_1238/m.3729 type:complete len:152 (-) Transcript_1238:32-487(-)
MLARAALRAARARAPRRSLSDAAEGLQLSFAAPHTVFYHAQGVESVTLPGVSGEYGVTKGHSPLAEQLRPGVVSIIHKAGDEPEKFFVSGGFAFTDYEKTEVSALEAVKLEDLDGDKIKAEYAAAAKDDSDEGKVAAETAKAMAAAIGVTL